MSQIKIAMILAAGRGERMRPLTDNCPKPLLKVAGKSLIEWHIDKLVRAGISKIVINTAYLGEQIEASVGDGQRWGIEILYSHEAAALETAGGIVNALPLIASKQFLVINGDVWNDWDYRTLCQNTVLDADADAYLYLVANPAHNLTGDFSLNNGKVLDTPEFTFSGVAIYQQCFFEDATEGKQALAPMLRKAMKKQRVSGHLQHGHWVDVGTPQRLKELDKHLTNNRD
ncbi:MULTISPECIES: N-acetylmuramate alpha-1-phosphate uridylyltransferase MurU [unclassified Agarivorans]|uniref:N-acetylmuramate alpha-1-phosphate uridylyltransferase MurU n=1 Tax=unclassified Agarivorans TaxID=2636026 RepID=UPI0026E13F9C|nr:MULTISPECIES: nucleotidyltransferase family protein [unclassified Agarivorans]MDO6688054.1 nucleotidyltransferase family protein [Agarivorans sp. 3_MG-2023]MDO6717627.1 nucleotidyltransferase family protein [Agarivorans sp. 2_MG-2023]